MTAPLYTQNGTEEGVVELPEELFSLPWSPELIQQAVVTSDNNRRAMTAHAKDRSAVRGGGRKPWRQKGTGRARHGSNRSPLWVGGGVTFGPHTQKDYRTSMNRKMCAKALFIALSERVRHGAVAFVKDIALEQPSTKAVVPLANTLTAKRNAKRRCIFIFAEKNDAVLKSFANIPGVTTRSLDAVQARDVLVPSRVVFVHPEKTLAALSSRASSLQKSVTKTV